MAEEPDDLEAAIDRLYQLPVGAFTEARNTLATARRAAGDTKGASRVKALVKPSVVAWAVNQVFWSERGAFDRVVGAVREVLAAQRGALVGDADVDVRGAMRRKGEALQAAVRVAERRIVEAGGTPSLAVQQRLAATLEVLAGMQVRGGGEAGLAGRLAADLQAAGFDMALGLADLQLPPAPRSPAAGEAPASTPASPVLDEGDRGPRARLAEAEAQLGRLQREVADAIARLGEAEQRALAARSDISSLEERLESARQRAEVRGREEEDARSRLAERRRALTAAEAERDRARGLVR